MFYFIAMEDIMALKDSNKRALLGGLYLIAFMGIVFCIGYTLFS